MEATKRGRDERDDARPAPDSSARATRRNPVRTDTESARFRFDLWPLAATGALVGGFVAGRRHGWSMAFYSDGKRPVKVPLQPKVLSNLAEVKARGAFVIAVCEAGDAAVAAVASETVPVAEGGDEMAMALKMAVPLQLLAYHVASRRGLDADMPRNLAKSVTVE